MAPLVSIIIPVLDDWEQLEPLCSTLAPSPEIEIIVAYAGRADPSLAGFLAARNVRLINAAEGRAVQMNAGARLATGEWLLFLHADCRLEPGWLGEVRTAGGDPSAVGGSFRFVLDSPRRAARLIERGVALRVGLLGLPYGDQALFVRRAVFNDLGGYSEMPLMEDVDLVRRLRRAGRLRRARTAVRSSARRWERDGWLRRSAGNMLLVALFHLGVDPHRLARMYDRERGTRN